MREWAACIFAIMLLAVTTTLAHASVFDFTVSGPNISGSGTLTGLPAGQHYTATGATGSLTIYGQTISILHAFGDFNRSAFQLQLYNDSLESVFFRGTDTGGFFTSSVQQLGTYTSFALDAAPSGGGAPLPEPGMLLSVLLTGGVLVLVMWKRARIFSRRASAEHA